VKVGGFDKLDSTNLHFFIKYVSLSQTVDMMPTQPLYNSTGERCCGVLLLGEERFMHHEVPQPELPQKDA